MATVDQQIQVLDDVAKLLTISTHALDEARLTRPFEDVLRALLAVDHDLRALKRCRGNAEDVLDEAQLERVWRNVMASIRIPDGPTIVGLDLLDGEGTP